MKSSKVLPQETIDTLCTEFRAAYLEHKELAAKMNNIKKQLTEHLNNMFSGNIPSPYNFPCNVVVTERRTNQVDFDPDSVSLEWLADFLEANMGAYVDVKLGCIPDNIAYDASVKPLLDSIGYSVTPKVAYTITVKP